jgi:hypothetical protein
MLSKAEQAAANLEQARALRAEGCSYRAIRRQLALTPAQLGLIRKALKREKASRTRLVKAMPLATDRDLPVKHSVLPPGLRTVLVAAGFHTLGDLADRVSEPELPRLETLAGIGPHKARLVTALLEHYDLLAGRSDLQASVERLFPEFGSD